MPNFWRALSFGLLAAGLFVPPVCAQDPPVQRANQSPPAASVPILRIPRVSSPPRLEEFLAAAPVEREGAVSGFRQYEPGDGQPASQETRAYLSYDDNNLYVVFVCKDGTGDVRAHLAKREDIEADDNVVVNIDTFHDHRRAYGFFVNPLGIQRDAIWTEGQGSDESFDTVWFSRGAVTTDGYAVWIAIPFKSLRFPRASIQRWGIELGRSIRHNNEMATWPYVTQRVESFAAQFATLEGLEGAASGRNVQFIPYGSASRGRFLDDRQVAPGAALVTQGEARGGLDAKVVLRDALTVDGTVNPDFSQVESDEPQVTVNQRFEVFFPEKRPFFIENAAFFQTPINLFFSRRIADPQFGGRMTGKIGRWAVGALAMDDRHGIAVDEADATGGRAGIGAIRMQREVSGQGSTVGFLATHRADAVQGNDVWAADTRVKLNENWTFTGQLAGSGNHAQGAPATNGYAAFVEIGSTGRHLVYASRYVDRSPGFRSTLGFIPRVDIRQVEQFVRYYWRPERGPVVLFGPDVTALVNWNREGRVQDWSIDGSFGGNIRGPIGFGCRGVEAFELFAGIGFRRRTLDCGIDAAWHGWLELMADYAGGRAINYYPAAGALPSLGGSSGAALGFTLRPSPRFRLAESYLFTRLTTMPRPATGRRVIFTNHILRSKLNYQFSRELSVRAIVDYNATSPDAGLVALEHTRRLGGDVLLTYLLNPGTALYVGCSDAYENVEIAHAGGPAELRRIDALRTSVGRQVFVKVSYLFRF